MGIKFLLVENVLHFVFKRRAGKDQIFATFRVFFSSKLKNCFIQKSLLIVSACKKKDKLLDIQIRINYLRADMT